MKIRLKWPAALLAIFIMGLLLRPSDSAFPRIPKHTLYGHYRVVCKIAGQNMSCGTGIAIGQRLLLTALHVVDGGETFDIDLFDEEGREIKTISAHLVSTGGSLECDIALLAVDEDLPVYNDLEIGDFNVGEWGYVIGCAHATCPYNVYVGIFASKHRLCNFGEFYQIAVTVPPGESGGGVYNAKTHKLVGVCVRSKEGFTLFVPIKAVLTILPK